MVLSMYPRYRPNHSHDKYNHSHDFIFEHHSGIDKHDRYDDVCNSCGNGKVQMARC